MGLSSDFRIRIVDLVTSGVSRREAARRFKVSASSAIRFVKQVEETGLNTKMARLRGRSAKSHRLVASIPMAIGKP